jgi:DeoR/GlpR family transcriptional regulator of sugar metabolism
MSERRRRELLALLQQEPWLNVRELTERLGVSPATVRRDLSALASEGKIERFRGGASVHTPLAHEPSWMERSRHETAAKRAIAQAALSLIEPEQVIAIDVGSTTYELARLLHLRSDLVIFTASVPIAQLLAQGRPGVYLIGGRLRAREQAVVGPISRDIIRRFHYDIFFLGAAGWSIEQGLMDFSMEDVEIKQTFIECSSAVVALVDSSKYGHTSLMTIESLSDVDRLITDDGLDHNAAERVREVTELVLAPVGIRDVGGQV